MTRISIAALLLANPLSLIVPGRACADDAAHQLAKSLISRAEMQRGVCVVLETEHQLPKFLAAQTEWLIHVREPDGHNAQRLRDAARTAGLGIDRLIVDEGSLQRLPYASNSVDLVIAPLIGANDLRTVSAVEVLRVLRPQGRAMIGWGWGQDKQPDLTPELLKRWASRGGAAGITAEDDDGECWVYFEKPLPEGIDEWTHWEKSPDNNPVSTDSVIRFPYMTQFMAKPYYIGMPSITTAAGGRTFLAIGHIAHHRREWDMLGKIIARNGYNGTILWERKLPEGYLVHRSAFIAGRDTFHMIDGDRCLLLGAKTGQEQGEIRIPELKGQWKWMALVDGVLYALAGEPEKGAETTKGDREIGGWSWADLSKGYYGKRIPHGFGDTLAAYDIQEKKTLWTLREESLIDSRGLAIRDEKLFLYCPERHLRCVNRKSGEVLWTNDDRKVLDLIEEPGKGLTSTPGWRTQTMAVATPDALILQGQTRMNVIAVSSGDGYLRWSKTKITNNPNAIFVDGQVILGVGPRGTHVAIEPISGRVEENLQFQKRACTRLTACADSLFCRGEGTLRYDRATKKVLVDGGQRPACNDGALPAHGLLYLGPWSCDCNLSLIGHIAKCSAGDFEFDQIAREDQRLFQAEKFDVVKPLDVKENDWPTYRRDNRRTAGTASKLQSGERIAWTYEPPRETVPTPPVSAGGLVFVAGEDGVVRAIDSDDGSLRWDFATNGPIKAAPTVAEDRSYVGSGDGCVYALEAATGRLLWKFRAAPAERLIMLYGHLCSTWPVNTGVLVSDGVAYFAAGVVDHDGTYVYALNAKTGAVIWQNNSCGHLNDELRKGISAQGNLALLGDRLLMAGGNQVSPAVFDRKTGKYLGSDVESGTPSANAGQFVGVLGEKAVVVGGRILYAAPENVATKASYQIVGRAAGLRLANGGIPPAWNDTSVAMVNFKHGSVACVDTVKLLDRLDEGFADDNAPDRRGWLRTIADAMKADDAVRWESNLDESNRFEAVSLAVSPGAVVAAVQFQQRFRSQPTWHVAAFASAEGRPLFRRELPAPPLPGGLLIDRQGHVVVCTLDGKVVRLGG